MKRKKFIQTSGLVAVGCCWLSPFMQGCSSYYFARHTVEGDKIMVPKSEFHEHPFVYVKHNRLPKPLFVKVDHQGEPLALHLECTHKGCQVRPTNSGFSCPCHGSQFSDTGAVVSEPADEPLYQFKTSEDSQNIIIHLPE